ncbi:MAG: hypothetical protein IKK52_02095 [Alphaproteobacteria bacterium]|nr:hypothetical protein [Alphaproteobacteria bacterium]
MEKLKPTYENLRKALHISLARLCLLKRDPDAVWIPLTELGIDDMKIMDIALDVAKQFDLPREVDRTEVGDFLIGDYRLWTLRSFERMIFDLITYVATEEVPENAKNGEPKFEPLALPADYNQKNNFEKKYIRESMCRQAIKNAIAKYKKIPAEKVFMWDLLEDYITSADVVPVLQLADINWCNEGLKLFPVVADDVEETFGNEKWVSKTVGDFARNLPRLISYKKLEAMAKKEE